MLIEIVDEVEHEDGSVTFEVKMTEESMKIFAEIGLRFSITMMAYDVTEEDVMEMIKNEFSS